VTALPLASLGWDAAFHASFTILTDRYPGDTHAGRVSRVNRGGADILTASGPLRTTFGGDVLAAMAADRADTAVVGDWVLARTWPDERVTLDAVLPRRTAVRRLSANATSQEQPLAANVDVVVVVEPLHPEPELGRIERLLVLAWSSGAVPLVVLTKADLVRDAAHWAADVAVGAPGVDVLTVSSLTGDGVEPLRAHLGVGRTLALLGPSGAGKSTLTNTLAGESVMVTRELRADGKGRHTTTHRELVPLPGGTILVDTPGLRTVGLVGDDEALATAFSEIEELAKDCRFRDCSHNGEPGCAVAAALQTGELDERRYESWRRLQREVRWQERRQDARLLAQERARWKSRTKSMRRSGQIRP